LKSLRANWEKSQEGIGSQRVAGVFLGIRPAGEGAMNFLLTINYKLKSVFRPKPSEVIPVVGYPSNSKNLQKSISACLELCQETVLSVFMG